MVTHFIINCSFSFFWFDYHSHLPFLLPWHTSFQTKWLHYCFRDYISDMPSLFLFQKCFLLPRIPFQVFHLPISDSFVKFKWHRSLWSLHLPLQQTSDQIRSDKISHSVVSDSLRPHESQQAKPPCPSPTPRVHWDSRPLSQWCHPAISSSVVPFSSCPQSLPASESRTIQIS